MYTLDHTIGGNDVFHDSSVIFGPVELSINHHIYICLVQCYLGNLDKFSKSGINILFLLATSIIIIGNPL